MSVAVGSTWVTGSWRERPREVMVEYVPEAGDEVRFRFLDGEQSSTCSTTAFLRTYDPK